MAHSVGVYIIEYLNLFKLLNQQIKNLDIQVVKIFSGTGKIYRTVIGK